MTTNDRPEKAGAMANRVSERALAVLLALVALLLGGCTGTSAGIDATDDAASRVREVAAFDRHEPTTSMTNAHAPAMPGAGDVGEAAHAAHTDHGAEPMAAQPLPSSSLYHLASTWRAHDGSSFMLPDLSGNAVVMVMFYGDCTTACPLLVRTAEEIAAGLGPSERARTRFVMVTFDTERDSPEKLRAYAAEKGLDGEGWHWLVGTPLQTRQLAAMLGVQYRRIGNGMFAHSNVVTVLDAGGVPNVRLEGLGVDVLPAVTAVRDILADAGSASSEVP